MVSIDQDIDQALPMCQIIFIYIPIILAPLDKNRLGDHSCCVLAVRATSVNSNKTKWEFNSSCIVETNNQSVQSVQGLQEPTLDLNNWINKIKLEQIVEYW